MFVLTPDQYDPMVNIAGDVAPARGAFWGMRTIPDFELILVRNGEFAYEDDEGVTRVSPGHVVCIPPGVRHVFRYAGKRKGAFRYIHSEPTSRGTWAMADYHMDPAPARVTPVEKNSPLPGLFQRCSETFTSYPRYRMPLLNTIVREVWLRLAEHWATGGSGRRMSPRMNRMLAYLRAHLTEPVTRRDLAAEFALTPEHVNTLFQKELGLTPTQFLHRERVLLAYRALKNEGLTVQQAAARVGFNDPFHFSKVFKRVMRIPPSAV